MQNVLKILKEKFSRYSLSRQINISTGFIICLAISIIIFITYIKTMEVLKQNFIDQGSIILQQTAEKFNSRINMAENTLSIISSEPSVLDYADPSKSANKDDLTNYLNNCIDYNKYIVSKDGLSCIQNFLDDILLISDNGPIIARKFHFTAYNIDELQNNYWFKKARNNNGKPIWTDYFYNNSTEELLKNQGSDLKSELNQFMLIQYVENNSVHKPLGFVALSINLENISELLDNINIRGNGNIYIIDENGRIIAAKNRNNLLKYINFSSKTWEKLKSLKTNQYLIQGTLGNKSYFIFSSSLAVNNWRMMITVPDSDFQSSVFSILILIVIIGILLFFISNFVNTKLVTSMLSPLKNIIASICFARSGNFSHKVSINGCLEVSQLSTEFNIMLEKIQELLNEIVNRQKAYRKMELKALRSQINPHFLYNTLDSVKWFVLLGDTEKASLLINSLSTFFRIGLSGGNEEITVMQELEHARQYLVIQKLRCGDKLNYIIDCSPDMESLKTPKLILQPVIENSILHGVNKNTGKGFIKISVSRPDQNALQYTVSDNGIGLESDKLEKLNEIIGIPINDQSAGDHGFALRNINQRIKLLYGEEYGIRLKSVSGKGMHVSITIPVIGPD